MKASISIDVVVQIIIAAAVIAVVLGIGTYVQLVGNNSADVACATAVRTATYAQSIGDPLELKGCETRGGIITSEDDPKDVSKQFVKDFLWCERSFAPARESVLYRKNDVFCHVCALYQPRSPIILEGVLGNIEKNALTTNDKQELQSLFSDFTLQEGAADPALELQGPTAITFWQSTNLSFFQDLLYNPTTTNVGAGGTAGLILAGAVVAAGTGGIGLLVAGTSIGAASGLGLSYSYDPFNDRVPASGIVISPYDEKHFNDLGCTIIDPSDA